MNISQFAELVVGGVTVGCIYSLIGLGFTMIIRSTNILHFAQGEVVMVGAMLGVSSAIYLKLPLLCVLAIGSVGGGILGAALELVVYRTMRLKKIPLNNTIIATVGVSLILQNASQLIWGSEPIAFPPLFSQERYSLGFTSLSQQHIWIIALGLAFMLGLQLFLRYTRTGLAIECVAQDPDAAQLMGISISKITAVTFGIAGLMAGAAGVLMGSLFFASSTMGFLPGIKAFIAATLGGLGSIGGAMLGGIVFGLIETFGAVFVSSSYKDAIGMIVLIFILLVAPQGLIRLFQRNSDR
jgi:branched-subunit amino acid ABC-type transport system permease component